MPSRRPRISRRTWSVAAAGRRAVSPHFSITLRESAVASGCSVVVSKKVAHLATMRNRLRRRVRAILAPWCEGGRSIIVYARSGSAALPFRTLSEELTRLLRENVR